KAGGLTPRAPSPRHGLGAPPSTSTTRHVEKHIGPVSREEPEQQSHHRNVVLADAPPRMLQLTDDVDDGAGGQRQEEDGQRTIADLVADQRAQEGRSTADETGKSQK